MAELSVEQQLMVREMLAGVMRGQSVRHLVATSREVFFPAGHLLFERGSDPSEFFIVADGVVRLEVSGEEAWTFDRGGIVGILDAVRGRPYERTAVAVTDVRTLAVGIDDWNDIVEDSIELTRRRITNDVADLLRRGLTLADGGFPPPANGSTALAALDFSSADGLNRFERLAVLRAAPFFSRTGTQALFDLARRSEDVRLAKGEVLYEEGDDAQALHFVARGLVRYHRTRPALAAAFGPTDLVGCFAGLGHRQRPFGARAGGEGVTLIAVSHEDFFDVMEDHVDLVRSVTAFLGDCRHRVQLRLPPRANG